jgi:type I restriction enzyme M protein
MKKNLDKVGITNQKAALRQAADQAFYNTWRFIMRNRAADAENEEVAA